MSRTIRGSKGHKDPWSARPFNKGGLGSWGSYARKRMTKAERALGKKEAKQLKDGWDD